MQQDNTTDEPETPNSGENVVKTTPDQQGSTEVIRKEQASDNLTAEVIKFINLVAKGYSATGAYKEAYSHKKLKASTIRYNASQLLTNPNIAEEIAVKKSTLARIARLAEDRIEDTLVNGRTGSKAVTDVSLAMYEHANGKARQQIDITSRKVSVNIDLTGAVVDTHAREHRHARTEE